MPQTHWNMPETFSKRCTCEQLPLSHSPSHSDEDDIPNRLSDINNVPLFFHFASVNGTKYHARTHQRNFGCFFIFFFFFVPMHHVWPCDSAEIHFCALFLSLHSGVFRDLFFWLFKSQWKGKRFWEMETPHQYAHQVHILLAMYDGHIHAVIYLWQFPVSSFYFQLLLRFAISQARCIDGALSFHEIFEGRCQQHVCVNSNQKKEKISDEYKMNVATESLRTTQCNDKIIICDRIKCQMNLIILFPVSPVSFFHSFVHFFDACESSYCAYCALWDFPFLLLPLILLLTFWVMLVWFIYGIRIQAFRSDAGTHKLWIFYEWKIKFFLHQSLSLIRFWAPFENNLTSSISK